ncbi:hypothetical protein DL240_04045 [Lujinxingia litoralis]|uniref:Uncharacterized protein n=1 Tax=Lujinxingia litoralis TaxID=2211119 RepID=A0A328CCJ5_9DELT|nr:PG0541 family transporter-associated protein [Lujinxingia litoralis]RAL25390.1 hypothetical protein DL240_04045 [Lujinxingia litoralis]
MKAVMITYNEVLSERLIDLLEAQGVRGFTRWNGVQGRGSVEGEPHMGNHIWPSLNGAMYCVVEDEQVDAFLDALAALDEKGRGLRAFVWAVERTI